MFEKLGIVTNIWAVAMENGSSFEDCLVTFGKAQLTDMEVREGPYLRNSAFGSLLKQLESAMPTYTDADWKAFCEAIWNEEPLQTEHPELFDKVAVFVQKASEYKLTLSYAMSHPWLRSPADIDADTQQIIRGKKLAYLLCPAQARLRVVDLDTEELRELQAVSNLKRYNALVPDYPITFAVENARQSALLTLELAIAGGAKLTYDEANTYRADGTTLNSPDEFWSAVKMENLTSVHFKQKTGAGVLNSIEDGFVDFQTIANHLRTRGYTGDLLLENSSTSSALMDALASREYLSRKGEKQ